MLFEFYFKFSHGMMVIYLNFTTAFNGAMFVSLSKGSYTITYWCLFAKVNLTYFTSAPFYVQLYHKVMFSEMIYSVYSSWDECNNSQSLPMNVCVFPLKHHKAVIRGFHNYPFFSIKRALLWVASVYLNQRWNRMKQNDDACFILH